MKNDLSTLSILHYAYGGFICLVGVLVFAIFFGMGHFLQSDWFHHHAGQAPPPELGTVMTLLGVVVTILVEAQGIANIISGRLLARYRGRVFSQIVAGINCLNIPLGIALGIFTFIELSKEPVKLAYGTAGAAR